MAAGHRGFEVEPAVHHTIGFVGFTFYGKAGGLDVGQPSLQHVSNLVMALNGLEVPGEGDKVTPIRFVGEQRDGGVNVASL